MSKQEQGEPVAFDIRCDNCGGDGYDPKNNNYNCSSCEGTGFLEKLLYTTPQPKQEQGEPVAYISERAAELLTEKKQAHGQIRNYRLFTHDVPVYTTPQQRTWVGLTDEEIKHIEETTTCLENESWLRNLTRNLEAKLKEKNT